MLDIICTSKEKNMGIFIFQALQNGVKHIEIRENCFDYKEIGWIEVLVYLQQR